MRQSAELAVTCWFLVLVVRMVCSAGSPKSSACPTGGSAVVLCLLKTWPILRPLHTRLGSIWIALRCGPARLLCPCELLLVESEARLPAILGESRIPRVRPTSRYLHSDW